MKIRDVIQKIKDYHYGYVPGETGSVRIDDRLSRDRILYGDAEKECTGIVTTCWANMDVIREAGKRGANLIICHEALFWNHGDHTEWLRIQQNRTFSAKTALLDQYGITVWR
ncbi:MAG: Nif3-like dinuclear metal center hexameric protein, partial [Solobacterium sp.]|nr:Nif3-like dinuclear metal center hexameric protein [Solobacterium sp.]